MSWKGFQRGVTRVPQTFKQRMNIGHVTKDPVYIDAERRFTAIEEQTKKLHTESKRYWDAITKMLNHQIEFSKAIEEVYQPISGSASDPDTFKPEGNPDGIAAGEQYRELVAEMQALLEPELELIQSKVLKPADELLSIIAGIKKMLKKRDHKQLDLDRHSATLKKLQDKKDRTTKDEEKLYKAENDVQIASEEFTYYNDMLKDELPRLFALETEFIRPLFQSFYYMQLNIYYTLYTRMEEMKIPYFDLNTPVVQRFKEKRGDIKEETEKIGITQFRVGHAKNKLEMTKRKFNRDEKGGAPDSPVAGAAAPPAYDPNQAHPGQPGQPYGQPAYGQPQPAYGQPAQPAYGQPQPAYGQPVQAAYGQPQAAQPVYGQPQPAYGQPAQPAYGQTATGYPQEKQVYQPPPAAAPVAAPATEWCTAIYDYAAQAAGDLSFSAGDRIEIVQRTADANGWWTGRLNGAQGVFPGNYVQLG